MSVSRLQQKRTPKYNCTAVRAIISGGIVEGNSPVFCPFLKIEMDAEILSITFFLLVEAAEIKIIN